MEAVLYGQCYRTIGAMGSKDSGTIDAIPSFSYGDLADPLELDLLAELAGAVPDLPGAMGTRLKLLRKLEASRFLGDVPTKIVIWFIKEVRTYLAEAEIRRCVQARVRRHLTPQSRVVIGHSLGSIVAYEVLRDTAHSVDTLVTLGSPLGLSSVRTHLARGETASVLPGPGVRRWLNCAAVDDPVCLVQQLKLFFGDAVNDLPVRNTTLLEPPLPFAHSVERYLRIDEVASAVADGIRS
jgi:pimeloyl-ACP methyl ester carboxylesterase